MQSTLCPSCPYLEAVRALIVCDGRIAVGTRALPIAASYPAQAVAVAGDVAGAAPGHASKGRGWEVINMAAIKCQDGLSLAAAGLGEGGRTWQWEIA